MAQFLGGVLTYTGRLQNAQDTGNRVTITVPLPAPPSYLPIISGNPAVNPTGAWFILNQWYRQTYYAISPGYAPGGVPPVGHRTRLPIYVDDMLARYELVYAAAGAPDTIFPIAFKVLVEVTGGAVVDIARKG